MLHGNNRLFTWHFWHLYLSAKGDKEQVTWGGRGRGVTFNWGVEPTCSASLSFLLNSKSGSSLPQNYPDFLLWSHAFLDARVHNSSRISAARCCFFNDRILSDAPPPGVCIGYITWGTGSGGTQPRETSFERDLFYSCTKRAREDTVHSEENKDKDSESEKGRWTDNDAVLERIGTLIVWKSKQPFPEKLGLKGELLEATRATCLQISRIQTCILHVVQMQVVHF